MTLSLKHLLFGLALMLNSAFAAQDVQESAEEISPLFYLEYSNKDEKIARELIDLSSSLRNFDSNRRATAHLRQLLKGNQAFSEFTPDINSAHKLFSKGVNSKNFYDFCTIETHSGLSPVAYRIANQLKNYCLYQFLEKFEGKKLNSESLAFIITNIELYTSHRFRTHLSDFLRHLKDEKSLVQVSEVITDYVINHNLTPSDELLENLKINNKLTNYIQNKGHNGHRGVFQRTLKRMTRKAQAFADKGDGDKALKSYHDAAKFFKANRKYISDYYAYKKFLYIAEDLIYNSKSHEAKILAKDAMNFFEGDSKDELQFTYLWADIIPENYADALEGIADLNLNSQDPTLSQKLRYWIGRIYLENGKDQEANQTFRKLIDKTPLNYYSILATKDLAQLKPDTREDQVNKLVNNRSPNLGPIQFQATDLSSKLKSSLLRLNVWLDLSMGRWAFKEMKGVLQDNPEELLSNENLLKGFTEHDLRNHLVKNLAALTNFKGDYLQTFKLVYSSINNKLLRINRSDIKSLFPLHYFKKVKKIDESIDPVIVLSLIRQESAFNPTAISSAGARGLMQLMPATAKMLERRVQTSDLENPQVNLKLGISYLKKLIKQYDGNLIYALAAYNAGPHRVKKWKKELFKNGNPLKIIEAIPFSETRLYVKLIYRNIFFYRFLREDIDVSKPVEETFKVTLRR